MVWGEKGCRVIVRAYAFEHKASADIRSYWLWCLYFFCCWFWFCCICFRIRFTLGLFPQKTFRLVCKVDKFHSSQFCFTQCEAMAVCWFCDTDDVVSRRFHGEITCKKCGDSGRAVEYQAAKYALSKQHYEKMRVQRPKEFKDKVIRLAEGRTAGRAAFKAECKDWIRKMAGGGILFC